MSYEKHNWVHGETITPALLNHMEDGVAESGKGLRVEFSYENETWSCDKTLNEIVDAFYSGQPVVGYYSNDNVYYSLCFAYKDDDIVTCSFMGANGNTMTLDVLSWDNVNGFFLNPYPFAST